MWWLTVNSPKSIWQTTIDVLLHLKLLVAEITANYAGTKIIKFSRWQQKKKKWNTMSLKELKPWRIWPMNKKENLNILHSNSKCHKNAGNVINTGNWEMRDVSKLLVRNICNLLSIKKLEKCTVYQNALQVLNWNGLINILRIYVKHYLVVMLPCNHTWKLVDSVIRYKLVVREKSHVSNVMKISILPVMLNISMDNV